MIRVILGICLALVQFGQMQWSPGFVAADWLWNFGPLSRRWRILARWLP